MKIKNVDYRYIFYNISKSEAVNLLEKSVLENYGYVKKYCLKFQSIQDIFFFTFFVLLYINGR